MSGAGRDQIVWQGDLTFIYFADHTVLACGRQEVAAGRGDDRPLTGRSAGGGEEKGFYAA